MSITQTFQTSLKLSQFVFPDATSESFSKTVTSNASWLLPQASAFIARVINPQRGVNGRLSFAKTVDDLRDRRATLTFDYGDTCRSLGSIIGLLTYAPRGGIIGTSNTGIKDSSRWNSAVPLILAALKEYKNIDYSEWDWTDPARIEFLDKDMYEYSKTFYTAYSFTKDELLEYQTNARTFKTGPKAGTQRSVASTTLITKTDNPDFNALPRLAKLALCQTWIFHPSKYNKFMITNPLDLDNPPSPLVDAEVVFDQPTTTYNRVSNWD
jgi:hypothetical protein